jgi:molecular chaperone DnaJ
MGEPDYYRVLGVRRDASPDDIKQAYHRLAAQCHPDLHPDDPDAEARLRSLNLAYAILRDPERRAHYDRWGAYGPPLWRPPRSTTVRAWIAAAVNHLLAVHAHLEAHQPQRGADLRYTLTLTPQDSRRGLAARLRVPAWRWCPQCLGSGMAGGKAPPPCARCHGARELTHSRWGLPSIQPCDACGGTGRLVTDPCRHCRGQGTVPRVRTLTIDVPPGIADGARLRIRGEGGPGRWGGPPGDLFVDVRIRADAAAAHQRR